MAGNEIFLEGSVGQSWWDEACFTPAGVRTMLDGRSGPLTVQLNSGGGLATDGQAIYAMLMAYPGDVTIVISGIAASAASLIAMAGSKVVMTLGSLMMIHDPAAPWIEGRGTEADHLKTAADLAVLSKAYAAIYAKRAGITADAAREIMRTETYYDGESAVAAGFATEVDDQYPLQAAAKFDYRIYAKAPSALRDGSKGLGAIPTREAVMAMFAGKPRVNPKKEPAMAVKKNAAAVSVGEDETDETTVEATETDDAEGEGATETVAVAVKPVTPTLRERARVRRLISMTETAGLPAAFAADHIAKGTSETAFLDLILAKKVENDVNHVNTSPSGAKVGTGDREKFVTGATLALQAKCGLPGGARNEFSSMSLSELARHALMLNGFNRPFADKREMIGAAFTMDAGAMTVSDFSNVLANIMNKSALVGWEEAEETFPLWTRKGFLADFKATKRVGVGVFAALPVVIEGADYTYGNVSDRGESIVLATYGKLARISRQAIINDDLNQLGDIPRRMGRAAKRTIGNLAYAVLTGNPAMSDTIALFHASHGNLAAAAGPPSVATLGAAKAGMRIQSDNGSALNIVPKYAIVPAALEMTTKQVIGSSVDPTTSKGFALNPVNNIAEIIVDARLDAASTTAWYMTADPAAYDTVEVAYLDGNDAPYLEQQTQWSADGVEMKVRIDAAVSPLDYRTMMKNTG